jgi:hypothetical protein
MAIGGGYVSGAYIGGIYLRPPESTRVAVEPLRDATVAEVSRIKGGFNRLEIPYVRAVYPALTEKYVDQARRTLRKAYTSGERDPRLLAELGLCECDAGNDAGAIEFLTGAVSARAPRPRCYYELSRIRLASLRKPESSRKLSGQEASRVVEPLLLMRGQQPALGEAYELMAETWLSSSGKPGPEHWAMLEEGVQLFGGRPRLLFLVAFLHRERGDVVNARVLIERGLGVVADPEGRTQFLRLRASLPAFSPEKNP